MTIQCPQCKSSDVKTTKVKKKETAAKIFMAVVGLGIAAFGIFGDWDSITVFDNPDVLFIVRMIFILMGSWIVWDLVTGLPLPFIGIRLIGAPMETHAVCDSCGHEWKEKGK